MTFPQFLETIAGKFAEKKSLVLRDINPEEYAEILSEKTEKIQALQNQIVNEKKRIDEYFDFLTIQVAEVLSEKRKACFNKLDQQVVLLEKTFEDFEQELKKLNSMDEELSSVFPTVKNLEKILQNTINFNELSNFIKGLHKKHDEYQELNGLNDHIKFQKKELSRLSQELSKEMKPIYQIEKLDRVEIARNLKNSLCIFLQHTPRTEKQDDQMENTQEIYLTLKVKSQNEEESFFKIKKTSELKKLIDGYCKTKNIISEKIIFMFDGEKISEYQTPEQLGMKHLDEIEVLDKPSFRLY